MFPLKTPRQMYICKKYNIHFIQMNEDFQAHWHNYLLIADLSSQVFWLSRQHVDQQDQRTSCSFSSYL